MSTPKKNPHAVALGKLGGSKGGKNKSEAAKKREAEKKLKRGGEKPPKKS